MNFTNLSKILKTEPKYRFKQINKAVFCDLISNWNESSNLPKPLREKLNKECPLDIPAKKVISKDKKTVKAVITLSDGVKIETVLLQHKDGRNTVCVSSQAGCPLGCSFCATGQMGFKRNLSKWEIASQVLYFARMLKKDPSTSSGQVKKVTNVVFMGMGEPFLNYDNVLAAIKILHEPEGFNLGARHFSISTVGIPDGIKKLSQEPLEINLAVSLHASNDQLRSKLIPINKKFPIKAVLAVVDNYIQKTNRRVMIEYLLADKLNDSEEDAHNLAELIKRPLYFVNLIACNSTGIYKPSGKEKIDNFKKILEKEKINTTERFRFGRDVKGACGQLIKN